MARPWDSEACAGWVTGSQEKQLDSETWCSLGCGGASTSVVVAAVAGRRNLLTRDESKCGRVVHVTKAGRMVLAGG